MLCHFKSLTDAVLGVPNEPSMSLEDYDWLLFVVIILVYIICYNIILPL